MGWLKTNTGTKTGPQINKVFSGFTTKLICSMTKEEFAPFSSYLYFVGEKLTSEFHISTSL